MTADQIIERLVDNWDHVTAHGRTFIVIEADDGLIDALAAFGAEREDLEPETIEDDDPSGEEAAA